MWADNEHKTLFCAPGLCLDQQPQQTQEDPEPPEHHHRYVSTFGNANGLRQKQLKGECQSFCDLILPCKRQIPSVWLSLYTAAAPVRTWGNLSLLSSLSQRVKSVNIHKLWACRCPFSCTDSSFIHLDSFKRNHGARTPRSFSQYLGLNEIPCICISVDSIKVLLVAVHPITSFSVPLSSAVFSRSTSLVLPLIGIVVFSKCQLQAWCGLSHVQMSRR